MAKKISLKKALLMSGLSMAVCSAMLVGTTFAWFSSTATSGVNTIVAGNLKVALKGANDEDLVDDYLFDKDFKWEPGAMMVSEEFKVVNEGTLALRYNLSVNMMNVVTANGHGLSEVIQYKIVGEDALEGYALDGTDEDTEAVNRAELWEELDDTAVATSGTLEENAVSDLLKVVLYWEPTDHDNDYNVDDVTLTTNFSVRVYATQHTSESDSFGTQYDKFEELTQEEEAEDDLFPNGNIILSSDLNMGDGYSLWFKGVQGILDLNGHTIENHGDYAALLVSHGSDVTLTGNGTIKRALKDETGIEVNASTLTIEGGTIDCTILVQRTAGTKLVINGGALKGWINIQDPSEDVSPEKGCVVINGGDFTDCWFNENDVYDEDGNLREWITLPEGYHWARVDVIFEEYPHFAWGYDKSEEHRDYDAETPCDTKGNTGVHVNYAYKLVKNP